jgi:DNA polymerase III subunit alpha
VCIATGRVLDDPKRPRDYSREQYLKSPEEMAALFADLPDALDNTVELAKRCNLELRLGTYYLPAFPVPGRAHLDSWIRSEAREGLERGWRSIRWRPATPRESYDARLDIELDVIIGWASPATS